MPALFYTRHGSGHVGIRGSLHAHLPCSHLATHHMAVPTCCRSSAAVGVEQSGSPASALSPRQRKLAAKKQQQSAKQHQPPSQSGTAQRKSQQQQGGQQQQQGRQQLQQQQPPRDASSKASQHAPAAPASSARAAVRAGVSKPAAGKGQLKVRRSVSPPREQQHKQQQRKSASPPPMPHVQQPVDVAPVALQWSLFSPWPQGFYIAACTSEQLCQLALQWAAEVAHGMPDHAQQYLRQLGADDSRTSREQGASMASAPSSSANPLAAAPDWVAACARVPRMWWASLSGQQQACALSTMQALAAEAELRLQPARQSKTTGNGASDSANNSMGHLVPASPAPALHVSPAMHPVVASRLLTAPSSSSSSSSSSSDRRGQPDVQGEARALDLQLTRQQHADLAWAVAHLACAGDAQLDGAMQRLHRALGVPFALLPMCLPGLRDEWFQAPEVELRQDTNYLDGGTRAVQEVRSTGWQSEGGHTFRYSGKEMQPQAGGLSPTIQQVRDELCGLAGIKYDSVLINLYPDGRAGMRYHVDPLYGCWTPETCVVSTGAPRKFVFRDMSDHAMRWAYTVRPGDLCCMYDDCQDRLQHAILTEKQGQQAAAHMASPFTQGASISRVSLVFKERIVGT